MHFAANRSCLAWLIGTSTAIQELRSLIRHVATSQRPVLVTGPTGSGKELVVRAIHALGCQPDAPLLDLNCGAFPEPLIESQLFGYERGAFTGAEKKHDGFFAIANGGTVFLDELAEMSLALQAKLLRVLETCTFRPIGATDSRKLVGRIIAATCADLPARVEAGQFREDLYYRLNVLEIRVPSLEERREDIPILLEHFASSQARPLVFTDDAMDCARRMRWPGNVRQLRNLIDRLTVFAPDGPITRDVLARFVDVRAQPAGDRLDELARAFIASEADDKLHFAESLLIRTALRLSNGNKRAAARILGVHRKVIERRTDSSSASAFSSASPASCEGRTSPARRPNSSSDC